MAKKISIIILLAVCLFSTFGFTVLAATPGPNDLVQCGRVGTPQVQAEACNFAAAVNMINKIITWLIMIAVPLAAIAFAYAGWLYLSAGDNSGQVTKAHTIFIDVGIGFILVLSAWLVFKLIATTFLNPSAGYGTYLN